MQVGAKAFTPHEGVQSDIYKSYQPAANMSSEPQICSQSLLISREHKSNPAQKYFDKFQARESDGELYWGSRTFPIQRTRPVAFCIYSLYIQTIFLCK